MKARADTVLVGDRVEINGHMVKIRRVEVRPKLKQVWVRTTVADHIWKPERMVTIERSMGRSR